MPTYATTRVSNQIPVTSISGQDYFLLERVSGASIISYKITADNLIPLILAQGTTIILDNVTGLSGYLPTTTNRMGQLAFLKGLSYKGDRQGGWYYYDFQSTGTPDGVGTVSYNPVPTSGRWISAF